MSNAQQVQKELEMIVARHCDWLDGRTFSELAQRVARGLFDDAPVLVDADAALTAARAEADA